MTLKPACLAQDHEGQVTAAPPPPLIFRKSYCNCKENYLCQRLDRGNSYFSPAPISWFLVEFVRIGTNEMMSPTCKKIIVFLFHFPQLIRITIDQKVLESFSVSSNIHDFPHIKVKKRVRTLITPARYEDREWYFELFNVKAIRSPRGMAWSRFQSFWGKCWT